VALGAVFAQVSGVVTATPSTTVSCVSPEPPATYKKILQEKAAETTKQKEEKRKKLESEEHEGTPQHLHCPNLQLCPPATSNLQLCP
jgi:hypothetical protein